MKGLAGSVLDAAGIDAASREDRFMLCGEIFSHHADDANLRKEAGRKRKISGRAAENLLAHAEGCFQAVEGNRADYEDGHVIHPPLRRDIFRPADQVWLASPVELLLARS